MYIEILVMFLLSRLIILSQEINNTYTIASELFTNSIAYCEHVFCTYVATGTYIHYTTTIIKHLLLVMLLSHSPLDFV